MAAAFHQQKAIFFVGLDRAFDVRHKTSVPATADSAPPFLHYSSGKVSIPFIIYVLEIFAKA